MSGTPFMPLWVSDFLGDTLDLDAAEVGAYMLLLMAQWNRDGASLPNDQKKLQRVARCGRNWPKIWGNIGRFFTVDDEGVYSKRLRLEAQNVAAKREVNARNGALGGKAKALKKHDAPIANATETLKRNPAIPEPEPYIEKEDTNVSSQKPAKRKSSMKEDWEITVGMVKAAERRGHSQQEAEAQFEKFKNNALANGRMYVDWDRAFVTWLDSPYFKPVTTGGNNGNRNNPKDGSGAAMAQRGAQRAVTRLMDFRKGSDAS